MKHRINASVLGKRRKSVAVVVVIVAVLLASVVVARHGDSPASRKPAGAVGAGPGVEPSVSGDTVGASSSPSASASVSVGPSASASVGRTVAPAKPGAPPAAGPGPGGGYPNAGNTGVQAGITLRDGNQDASFSKVNSMLFADAPGRVYQNLEITGSISVSVSNVTIKNVRVNCTNGAAAGAIHQAREAENLTIDHVTIVGSRTSECQYGVLSAGKGTTVRFSNISLVTDGIAPYGLTTVEDNYIHDLTFFPGDHVAAFGYDGGNAGVGPIVIRHNTFDDPNNDGNNLVAMYSQNGPIVNATVDDNWLAGSGHIMWAGGYPADCSASPGVHDVKIRNNRFSTKYFSNGGSFSAVVGWCPNAPGNVWSGNVWADGPRAGSPIVP